MTFEPQNELEHALVAAAGDPASHPRFYRAFIESDVFIVRHAQPSTQTGEVTFKAGDEIPIEKVEYNGRWCVPVFSSRTRLPAVAPENIEYLSLKARDLLEMAHGMDLLLNPGSDYGKEFTKEEVQSLLDGSIWKTTQEVTVEKPTTMLIGQPARYPHKLTQALTRLFRQMPEVKRAYLAHVFIPEKDKQPHTLIGIEVTSNWEKIVAEAAMVAKEIEIPDPPVDFIEITGKNDMGRQVVQGSRPFYRKKLFGWL